MWQGAEDFSSLREECAVEGNILVRLSFPKYIGLDFNIL